MSRCGCSNNNNGCGCNNMSTVNATLFNGIGNNMLTNNSMIARDGIGVTNLMYGHAYVPNQTLTTIYSPEQGLDNGTMFPELVSVYVPNQSLATMNYLKNYNWGGCR